MRISRMLIVLVTLLSTIGCNVELHVEVEKESEDAPWVDFVFQVDGSPVENLESADGKIDDGEVRQETE